MKVESYKTQIVRTEGGKYFGELWVNNCLHQKTNYFENETVAILRLNKRIESFNAMENTNIPPYQKEVEPKLVDIDVVHKHQPRPRRKPFTPYGLNGCFVDKQGNIRLHLDRKAHAHTIVLNPEMFSMLANMVQATQEQNNETLR